MVRLEAIVDAISGVVTTTRNEIEFDDTQLPAITILEGDEESSDTDASRGRPPTRPYIVTMIPQVFIRVRKDEENVGTLLNRLRAAVIKAVLSDTALEELAMDGPNNNGRIRYVGMQSTLHAARSMVGAMALTFAITYVLNPSDL